MRTPVPRAMFALLASLLCFSGGTHAQDATAPTKLSPSPGRVVASTTWAAAFARAAGARDVIVVASANLPHPPDYDPRPSDLAAVAEARFVVMAPFDGFARRLREAAGSSAQVIAVDLVNAPETIHTEVTKLGRMFGTEAAADAFLRNFDAEYARLRAETMEKIGADRPKAVAQRFMAPWAQIAGLELVGTYGPGPLQPIQLAELVAKGPGIVLKNGHSEREGAPSPGRAIAETAGAEEVALINFPNDQDLLSVFRENARRLAVALGK